MEEELDIYTEQGIEEYVDEDSISSMEQGFMIGYLSAWKCLSFLALKNILWSGRIIRQRLILLRIFIGSRAWENKV